MDGIMEKLETPNILSFSMYMDMMNLLKYEAEVEEKNSESRPRASVACEFESSFDFKESFTRHKRMKENMNTKQLQPLTASQGKKELNVVFQQYGFHLISIRWTTHIIIITINFNIIILS